MQPFNLCDGSRAVPRKQICTGLSEIRWPVSLRASRHSVNEQCRLFLCPTDRPWRFFRTYAPDEGASFAEGTGQPIRDPNAGRLYSRHARREAESPAAVVIFAF